MWMVVQTPGWWDSCLGGCPIGSNRSQRQLFRLLCCHRLRFRTRLESLEIAMLVTLVSSMVFGKLVRKTNLFSLTKPRLKIFQQKNLHPRSSRQDFDQTKMMRKSPSFISQNLNNQIQKHLQTNKEVPELTTRESIILPFKLLYVMMGQYLLFLWCDNKFQKWISKRWVKMFHFLVDIDILGND